MSSRTIFLALAAVAVATTARAQVTQPLVVSGNLVIAGDSTLAPVQFTNGVVQAGSVPQTITASNVIIRGGKTFGQSCGSGADCWATDFCEDGVCCCNCSPGNTVINGVATKTCYGAQYPSAACPLYGDVNATGASYQCQNCAACNKTANGTCGATTQSRSSARAGSLCRAATDVCDAPEQCDGVSQACPTDRMVAASPPTVCRLASGLGCDVNATCDGSSPHCAPNPLLPPGTVCRATDLSSCRGVAACSGVSSTCPPGPLLADGTICRQAQGQCDVTDRCDGKNGVCANGYIAAGTVCDPSGVTCSGSSAYCTNGSGTNVGYTTSTTCN